MNLLFIPLLYLQTKWNFLRVSIQWKCMDHCNLIFTPWKYSKWNKMVKLLAKPWNSNELFKFEITYKNLIWIYIRGQNLLQNENVWNHLKLERLRQFHQDDHNTFYFTENRVWMKEKRHAAHFPKQLKELHNMI